MRFCEAEYNAPSVVSHHENPASEPSVFWSAGCPSFGPMLRIALCTFGKLERRIGRGKPTHQSERERRMRPRSRIAKPPQCRLEGSISKVPFLINRIEIKI